MGRGRLPVRAGLVAGEASVGQTFVSIFMGRSSAVAGAQQGAAEGKGGQVVQLHWRVSLWIWIWPRSGGTVDAMGQERAGRQGELREDWLGRPLTVTPGGPVVQL